MSLGQVIIQHGDRVTEHDVGNEPLVVGRDPQCDLFFADKKLSRRHASFERAGNRLKLVDLGSRNGCWVNEERVEEMLLAEGDSIRLGSLQISFRAAAARPTAEKEEGDSTMLLANESSLDESGTVVLASASLPDAEPKTETEDAEPGVPDAGPRKDFDDSGTVFLPATGTLPPPLSSEGERDEEAGGEDEDPTLLREDENAGTDQTVVLGAAKGSDSNTGTVIFRGQADPSLQSLTRVAPAETGGDVVDLDGAAAAREPDELSGDIDPTDEDFESRPARPEALRRVLLVIGLTVLAVAVLALPLMRTLGQELRAESALRARALVDLLAATNERALEQGRLQGLSLARVAGEPGIIEAYVLDPRGKPLAPGGVELSPWLMEVEEDVVSLRTFRRREAVNGDLILLKPIRRDGRRLGVAALRYRSSGNAVWTLLPLSLGVLLLVMGLAAALLLAHRWSLKPVTELRDDVDALRSGYLGRLPEDRPYSELSEIARSFNELLYGEPDVSLSAESDATAEHESAGEN